MADLPIRSDGFSYYVYLPSWFLFGDPTLAAVARDCCGGEFPEYTAIIRWPETRRWVNAHPDRRGDHAVAGFCRRAPADTLDQSLTRTASRSITSTPPASPGSAGLSPGFACCAALLLRSFSDRVTAATLLALLLGTNLYHYATFDSCYSHPYSFFLFAAFMWLTARWHAEPGTRQSILLGIVDRLIVLVRHTNILFTVVFVAVRRRRRHRACPRGSHTLLARAKTDRVASWPRLPLVIAPQLLIYYQATGRCAGELIRRARVQLDVAAARRGSVRRQEGTVLLVAAAAARCRRDGPARHEPPGRRPPSSSPARCSSPCTPT